ncbi:MAG: hypothetical protein ACI9ZX_002471 [Algoriphagus sp.]|jgi:hypothetical protein
MMPVTLILRHEDRCQVTEVVWILELIKSSDAFSLILVENRIQRKFKK